jgi:signal transduction histidine kinase
MSVTPLPPTSFKSEIYEILRFAYHDASELSGHRDEKVAQKGRDIKKRVNQCLDYARRFGAEPAIDQHSFSEDGALARQMIMRACIRDFVAQADATSVEVVCSPKVVVRRNASAIGLILRELCQNAYDVLETQKDARIRVSLSLQGKLARICVEDNGPGIPRDTLDELFPTILSTAQRHEGKALARGLSIAIRTARAIGAELTLLWTSNQGTGFCLSLSSDDFETRDGAAEIAPAVISNAKTVRTSRQHPNAHPSG